MSRLLGWPVRVLVAVLLLVSLAVDGAGRVPWLPAGLGGVQVASRLGLDLAGGTSLTLQMSGFPPGRDPAEVQQRTIDVIETRVNALGVSEPIIQGAGGSRHDRIEVQPARPWRSGSPATGQPPRSPDGLRAAAAVSRATRSTTAVRSLRPR